MYRIMKYDSVFLFIYFYMVHTYYTFGNVHNILHAKLYLFNPVRNTMLHFLRPDDQYYVTNNRPPSAEYMVYSD